VAYHVLCQSILAQSSKPVSFTPINKRNIPDFTRGIEDGSTEFSFSRFLTPWLCGYEGKAIFMDCDMVVNCDISELLNYCKGDNDVWVCKHDYTPKTESKFLGNKQHVYPRKNWSSVMVFDCDRCRILTPDVVNSESGAYLHQFKWADGIGGIPLEYNWLVGEYNPNPNAKILHYTLGTPCFGYKEYSEEWFKWLEMTNYADQ
jgi:hypothetical protein